MKIYNTAQRALSETEEKTIAHFRYYNDNKKCFALIGSYVVVILSDEYSHTSHTKIRHTTINYAALGIWKRFFQFSGSLLIKRDTSSAIWHSDAL